MQTLKKIWGGLCCVLLLTAIGPAQNVFYLKDGDRVLFYGDSITDQRLYTTFVETYVVTRFPKLNVSFVHSGWGGDRVTGGAGGPIDKRLQRDLFAYKPTVVTVMLGMNDGSYRAFDPKIFDAYSTGYQSLVQKIRAQLPGVRMTLIQPSPYDDATRTPLFEGGYNAVLLRYAQFIKEYAAKEQLDTADLNTNVVAALRKAAATDPAVAQRIIPDRVHPGPGGHLLMAAELLRAWRAPALVTGVEIDAAKGEVTRAANTKLSDLKAAEAITWTQEDGALPLPIDRADAATALAVQSSDVIKEFNWQPLKVTGLKAARYQLRIDGELVGTFTKDELAEGINLTMLPTPMLAQARAVHALTLKHNNTHFAAWRSVQVPFEESTSPNVTKAIEALNALETEVIAAQRATAQPKARRYEMTPAP